MAGIAYYAWFLGCQIATDYPEIALYGFDGLRIGVLDAGSLAAVRSTDLRQSPLKHFYHRAQQVPVLRSAYRKLKVTRFTHVVSQFDIYHAMNSVPPTEISKPVLPLIHDISHERMPEAHPAERVAWLRKHLKNLDKYPLVNTISEFSAREIADCYGYPFERIRVTHPGVNPRFCHSAEPQALERVREMGLHQREFFLTVGTIEPRKNHDVLIDAYARLSRSFRQSHPLIFAGQPGWGGLTSNHAQSLRDDGSIRFTGYIDEATLHALYVSATALLFPTLYEGFGIPIMEALAAGLPVIASDITVMHEVAGDAARFLPPREPEAWSDAILAAQAATPEERRRASVAAIDRSLLFSWEENARSTVAIYRELADLC